MTRLLLRWISLSLVSPSVSCQTHSLMVITRSADTHTCTEHGKVCKYKTNTDQPCESWPSHLTTKLAHGSESWTGCGSTGSIIHIQMWIAYCRRTEENFPDPSYDTAFRLITGYIQFLYSVIILVSVTRFLPSPKWTEKHTYVYMWMPTFMHARRWVQRPTNPPDSVLLITVGTTVTTSIQLFWDDLNLKEFWPQ